VAQDTSMIGTRTKSASGIGPEELAGDCQWADWQEHDSVFNRLHGHALKMEVSTKTKLFLLALLVLTMYHYFPLMMEARRMETLAISYKLRFNEMLESGKHTNEHLRMMKSLINNIKHCKNRRVLEDGTYDEIKAEYDGLRIDDGPVFLRLSLSYNLSTFAPVFLPIFMQALRLIKDEGPAPKDVQ
jgi:hypothetical protein